LLWRCWCLSTKRWSTTVNVIADPHCLIRKRWYSSRSNCYGTRRPFSKKRSTTVNAVASLTAQNLVLLGSSHAPASHAGFLDLASRLLCSYGFKKRWSTTDVVASAHRLMCNIWYFRAITRIFPSSRVSVAMLTRLQRTKHMTGSLLSFGY